MLKRRESPFSAVGDIWLILSCTDRNLHDFDLSNLTFFLHAQHGTTCFITFILFLVSLLKFIWNGAFLPSRTIDFTAIELILLCMSSPSRWTIRGSMHSRRFHAWVSKINVTGQYMKASRLPAVPSINEHYLLCVCRTSYRIQRTRWPHVPSHARWICSYAKGIWTPRTFTSAILPRMHQEGKICGEFTR